MKLENQVISLELAKKLKELGVKQESLFWWYQIRESEDYSLDSKNHLVFGAKVSAFTVAELGEMLPRQYELPVRGKNNTYGSALLGKWGDTEADARAKMLIYLLENNLIPAQSKPMSET